VEVWDAQAWSTYQEQTEPDYIDQAEEIFPGLSF
jgi:MraZ protein